MFDGFWKIEKRSVFKYMTIQIRFADITTRWSRPNISQFSDTKSVNRRFWANTRPHALILETGANGFGPIKETTLERADFASQQLMFLTSIVERKKSPISFLPYNCQLLSPQSEKARTGWAYPYCESQLFLMYILITCRHPGPHEQGNKCVDFMGEGQHPDGRDWVEQGAEKPAQYFQANLGRGETSRFETTFGAPAAIPARHNLHGPVSEVTRGHRWTS